MVLALKLIGWPMKLFLSKAIFSGLCVATHLNGYAEAITFDAAWQRLQDNSDQLAGAKANQASKVLQADGIKRLSGRPSACL